jgi:hypothetical protein
VVFFGGWMIEFICESCSQRQQAFDEQLGKTVFCPHCSSMSKVEKAPPRWPVTGDTDFHHFGFSVDTLGKYERSLKAGMFSGFSRRTGTQGWETFLEKASPSDPRYFHTFVVEPEYYEWLQRFRRHVGLTEADLISHAIAWFAMSMGFNEAPPEVSRPVAH